MKLNYRLLESPNKASTPIVLIHGLFGSLDNLGVLARDLQPHYPIIQVDLRNHGQSPRSPEMNYDVMAQDLLELLDELSLAKVIVIAHSMGGKVAMALTAVAPDRVEKLVVIDMAPIDYNTRRHDSVFAALQAVTQAGITDRREAHKLMQSMLKEEPTIQFLLKSFHNGEWRFNVPVLLDQYENIIGWNDVPSWPHPVLFLKGEHSPYIQDSYRENIARQFPQARAHVIADSGHWIHAEKPQQVLRAIHRFLDTYKQ